MLSDNELPPLPEPRLIGGIGDYREHWDADQMREYGRACKRAAYERAAQECIETAAELRRCADGCTDGRYDWKADGALDCADAIRALGAKGE